MPIRGLCTPGTASTTKLAVATWCADSAEMSGAAPITSVMKLHDYGRRLSVYHVLLIPTQELAGNQERAILHNRLLCILDINACIVLGSHTAQCGARKQRRKEERPVLPHLGTVSKAFLVG